jgi:hypothetical protein
MYSLIFESDDFESFGIMVWSNSTQWKVYVFVCVLEGKRQIILKTI